MLLNSQLATLLLSTFISDHNRTFRHRTASLPSHSELLYSHHIPILVVRARAEMPCSCYWTLWRGWGSTRVMALFLVQINLVVSVKADVGTPQRNSHWQIQDVPKLGVYIISVRDNSDYTEQWAWVYALPQFRFNHYLSQCRKVGSISFLLDLMKWICILFY